MDYILPYLLLFFVIVMMLAAAFQILMWRPTHSSKPRPQTKSSNRRAAARPAVSNDPLDDPAQVERIFQSVFAIMTEERRSALLDRYMRNGDVHAAMKLAILDRQRDETRFDS
ncbi:hypothetical protein [Bradyrhizobium japonicum]|uniref:hypothetical protein n=1 Tax=Bradyrhizobium japonicum TaxID=375 RepID=UPI001E596E0C|nr:hypothetical protein [Bradyrhizobium japonicum]MCD9892069.1 hypothetical protein [Bradyrhizobium japonicum]WRJ83901.1 hypothetical protein R3F78_02960 [Bradyrhizobium japonicum]WRJ92870.1 hypothetical protein R3F77_00675 [Bradyrhizobium japonicum]WRK46721.1 hypothetical protein R3F73_00730 [Bradyrhizobium japonicum]